MEALIQESSNGLAESALILLHGLGSDGHDMMRMAEGMNVNLPIRIIAPHAPMRSVAINGGMPCTAWYDVESIGSDDSGLHFDQLIESVQQIADIIQLQIESGIPSEKIVLMGFSQGASVALHTGLMLPMPLAGVAALSGFLPFFDRLAHNVSAEAKKTPFLVAHGQMDDLVPSTLGERAVERLKSLDCNVQWHLFPDLGHSIDQSEMKILVNWLSKCLFSA